jgi:tetratricopeptide (TPR) repeat protein
MWFSPKVLRDRYALSDDTRTKGMTDLRELGLINISRQPINPGDFDLERIRNAYTLNLGTLNHPARRQQTTPLSLEPLAGQDDPDTLTTRRNLAYAYQAAGDLGRAIPQFEQALADYVRVLGQDDLDTLTTRANLAYAYQAGGDPGRAIPQYQQALTDYTRILGQDHPNTLTTRRNLAYAYQAAGDLGRAIPQFEQALADSVRILGEDHPQTKIVRDSLATARQQSE